MKKIGLVVLAMVMALGALGLGYAWWTQNLTISGSVSTGELEVEISSIISDDPEQSIDPNEAYDVACTAVGVDNPLTAAHFTITNAYPGYDSGASITITNTGTVPVKVTDATLANFVPGGFDPDYVIVGNWTLTVGATIVSGSGYDFSSIENTVLEATQAAVLDVDFSFSEDMPDAMENVSVSFDLVVTIGQFNET